MSKRRSRARSGNPRPSIRPQERTSKATDEEERERRDEPDLHWEISKMADSHELNLTAECIADIAECLISIRDLSTSGRLVAPNFQRQIRFMSVPIRKLILSGYGPLLRRCFVPRFHPLKMPGDHEPDVLTEWIGEMAIFFTMGESPEERRASFPTEHTHETVVKPLYGLRRIGEKKYLFEDPFDWTATPVKYAQWLNSKVVQIDDTVLSAGELLRMMANREGAHSDRDELTHLGLSGPMNISLPDAGDEAYRKANAIKFSQLSYIQVFTYLVGIYLVNMMKASLRYIPAEIAKYGASRDTWHSIISAPSEPLRHPLDLEKDYGMGAVLQSTNDPDHPFELIGDYEANSTTTVQIPTRE